jgi:DNA-binding response OmpR family regulator
MALPEGRLQNGAGLQLLYVEDNVDLRESLSAALSCEGYEVQVAGDAGEGLARLGERRFHLVISDYGLPDQTGAWMLREAAARGLLERTEALIVTAHAEPVESGGIPVLQKPLDVGRLLAWIARLLRS